VRLVTQGKYTIYRRHVERLNAVSAQYASKVSHCCRALQASILGLTVRVTSREIVMGARPWFLLLGTGPAFLPMERSERERTGFGYRRCLQGERTTPTGVALGRPRSVSPSTSRAHGGRSLDVPSGGEEHVDDR
jgi:hypothetical protein